MSWMHTPKSSTTGPVAAAIGLSRRQISRLIASGVIHAHRIGARGRFRVDASELKRLRRLMGKP
jgi:excisionase family DNA binding protein